MSDKQEPKRGRGRPKKQKVSENLDIVTEEKTTLRMGQPTTQQGRKVGFENTPISFDQYNDKIKATDSYGVLDLNRYNPFLDNTRLKTISSYPSTFPPEKIAEFVQQPQWNEQALRSASWSLSASQYLYYKILREACDIPMFKHYVIPPLLEKEEYNTKYFKEEEAFVEEWLERFDIINTLKRVALEVKREGKSTYVMRQSIGEHNGKKYPQYVAWQKLPSNFTKLTAIGERGYIASFDLMVFLNPAFSPTQYPDFIQEIWRDLNESGIVANKKVANLRGLKNFKYKDPKNPGANKAGLFEMVADTYMYWVELPQEMCFTFASDTSNAWVAPDTMGLFSSLQELNDYSILAGLVASTPLTAILTGQAETVKDPEPGQSQTILSPSTMLAFQNAFNAIASTNTKAFLAPFKDLKLQSLTNVPNSSNIKTAALQNFVATAGEGGLIVATDKPSVAMIKGAQQMAASQYESVTRQFESVLNMLLQTTIGTKYDWRIKIWGDIFSFDSTVKSLKEQVQTGSSYLLPKLASAQDMSMRQVRAINNYIEAFEVYEGMRPMNYSTTLLGTESPGEEAGEVGRPKVEIEDLENDNTATSQEAGNNVSEIKDFTEEGTCSNCGEPSELEQCEVCTQKNLEEGGFGNG